MSLHPREIPLMTTHAPGTAHRPWGLHRPGSAARLAPRRSSEVDRGVVERPHLGSHV